MRILHVSDCYLPRTGGIELHVRDLAARQRAAGLDVTVVTATAGPQPAEAVIRLPGVGTLPQPRALTELSRMIPSGGYDVVHAHSSLVSPLARQAARVAGATGTPAVVTMHSMLPSGFAARALASLAPAPSPGLVWTAVSSAAAVSLQVVLRGSDVSVLPNGVDPQDWSAREGPPLPHPLTLVSVMRTARRKRPLQLLDILAWIRDAVPAAEPLRAVLVGSGPLDGAIRRKLAATGMDRWVSHAGQLDRTEIRGLLHRSDLYLAPAELESFGIAALEARCAGLPVIGMARCGIRDFISDGVEGFLVDSDAELAERAALLLTDRVRLAEMQRHNRATAPAISWPHVLDLHQEVYRVAAAMAGRSDQRERVAAPAGSLSGLSGF
jgi:glycosyltransferase involved in cell wall biosynthesis